MKIKCYLNFINFNSLFFFLHLRIFRYVIVLYAYFVYFLVRYNMPRTDFYIHVFQYNNIILDLVNFTDLSQLFIAECQYYE